MRLRTADIYGGMIPSRLREDETLPALAQSIARHGLLQPIVVQENLANGRYMLVCGARRLLDRPEETQACGKRRAVRRAAEEAQRLSDALNAQGIPACASMHAQGQGLCIQILLKNERLS